MKIIATDNMKKAVKETMDSNMNICYLINRGNLTWEEREEIILEYINRLFSTLAIREQVQTIGNELMKEIMGDEKCNH